MFFVSRKKDCSSDLFGSLSFQPDLVNLPYTKHNRSMSILFPIHYTHESKKVWIEYYIFAPIGVYSANSVSSFKIIFNPLCSNTVLHVSIRMTIIWLFLYCTLFKASCILMPWEIDHIELKKWCLLHKQLNKQNTMKWLPFFSCIFIQISLDDLIISNSLDMRIICNILWILKD